MASYIYLFFAITAEIVGTLELKATRGFTVLIPSLVVVASYAVAFFMLSLALRTIPVGMAYAIWSGVGTAAVAIFGVLIFGERLNVGAIAGILLIIAGVIVLQLSASSNAASGVGQ